MKIAIICYNHFDATISLAKYLYEINEGVEVNLIFILSRSYLDVEIINLKNKHAENGFIDKKKLAGIIDKEIFNYLDDKIDFDIFIFNSYKLADFKNIKLLFLLKNKIVNDKYDLLHFVGHNPWIVFLHRLIKHLPKIYTLHEPYPFIRMNGYRLLRFKLTIKLVILGKVVVVVPSQVSFDRLKFFYKIPNAKVSIIPFGPFEIYKEYAEKNIIKEDNLLLYYGHISEYKGVDLLFTAMVKVSENNKIIKLIIAGGGGTINKEVTAFNPNIKVINRYLSNKEIAELNQSATIVVCPYTAASQSGVVMTTFAFGNPIIATKVGALPEMIEDDVTGIIIEPGNSDALYKAIIQLFEDPIKINKLRSNVASKYSSSKDSWSYIAFQTYELYKKQLSVNKN